MIDFPEKDKYDINDFRRLIFLLRQKDGCPWDRVQTHHSIRNNFLEETYEACEAIDLEDSDLLKEELGDVLMQVIFHASIEEEEGRFNLDDVADAACRKLIYRHPKLFGAESAPSWDELKRQERGMSSYTESLEQVARSLPSLWRAGKVQKRASASGFRWDDISGPLRKLEEELSELQQAVEEHSNIEEELGDLLFAAAAVARSADIDPEHALNCATDKFIRRFSIMEPDAGPDPRALSSGEWLALWQAAKQKENS